MKDTIDDEGFRCVPSAASADKEILIGLPDVLPIMPLSSPSSPRGVYIALELVKDHGGTAFHMSIIKTQPHLVTGLFVLKALDIVIVLVLGNNQRLVANPRRMMSGIILIPCTSRVGDDTLHAVDFATRREV